MHRVSVDDFTWGERREVLGTIGPAFHSVEGSVTLPDDFHHFDVCPHVFHATGTLTSGSRAAQYGLRVPTAHLVADEVSWQVEYKSDQWWDALTWTVGGSDIGAICGLSPWRTRDQLLEQMLHPSPSKTTASQARGLKLEAGVLAVMAEQIAPGMAVREARTTVTHRGRRFSPDGLLDLPSGTVVLCEAKTTDVRAISGGWGKPSPSKYQPDRIPQHYLAQVQWGLDVLGLEVGYLGVLSAATDMSDDGTGARTPRLNWAMYRVDADPSIQQYLNREATQFLADLAAAKEAAA